MQPQDVFCPSGRRPGSTGEHRLQQLSGTQKRAYAFYNKQMLDHLNLLMRQFISRQEMLFISTADSQGECDCSFRAGRPGFVQVLDEKTLTYPELRGNGVMASLGNISENRHVGILFIDFFESTVGLHVNGKACIAEPDVLLGHPGLPEKTRRQTGAKGSSSPEHWVLVEVEEAYIHCAKHLPLLKKLDKKVHWGTDDEGHKGGDYFKAKASIRSWTVNDDEPEAV
jgi:predicted pyridoxine 5'-phosphate oxidase superfamily flavin-nucleotide-binding protein